VRENELLVSKKELSPAGRLERRYNWFLVSVFIAIVLDSIAHRIGLINEKTMLVLAICICFGSPIVGIAYFFRRRKLRAIEKSQALALTDTTDSPAN
jgi:hypothetical protein